MSEFPHYDRSLFGDSPAREELSPLLYHVEQRQGQQQGAGAMYEQQEMVTYPNGIPQMDIQ